MACHEAFCGTDIGILICAMIPQRRPYRLISAHGLPDADSTDASVDISWVRFLAFSARRLVPAARGSLLKGQDTAQKGWSARALAFSHDCKEGKNETLT